MKKIVFSFVIAVMTIFSANAQIAREIQAKPFDNVSVSVQGGVTTPLDMNGVFPLNAVAGLRISKEFTPIFGVEVEGNVWFGDNHFNRNWTNGNVTPVVKTFVKATNVGVNGTANLSNLFFGYKGKPRTFEVKAVAGLGWLHYWDKYSTPKFNDEFADVEFDEGGYLDKNGLSAKTALQFMLNLDNARKHTVFIEPGVFWNLSYSKEFGSTVQFNQKYAQLGVTVGYTHHFGCSNGTHHFVLHDVGALNDEINRLRNQEPQVITNTVTQTVEVPGNCDKIVVIEFAFDKSELSEEAMSKLDDIKGKVSIEAFASPEGNRDYNLALSQRRADAVAQYLADKGATIIESVGCGVNGETSNRIAIVRVK